MNNELNWFEEAAWEAFQEAALDKYDFQTCQRPDGTYYGTGGTCKKGTPVSGTPRKKTKKMADMRAKDLKRRGVSGKNHGKTVKASGGGSSKKKDPFAKQNAMAKKEEAKLRKKAAKKKPDGGLTEAQVRAGGGRLD